jgi:hypothetical protein
MTAIKSTFATVALALACALPASAQQPARAPSTGGNSPHETTSAVIDGSRVTITYGRPSAKGRKIWGTAADKALVPDGAVWRTGSDEATILITQQPLELGGTTIPAGAYSLWTLPNSSGTTKLIVNKQIGQWGADRDLKKIYDEKNDVARVDLKKDATSTAVEQFTMAVQKNPAGGGLIKLSWENTEFSVPFTIKK